MKESLDATEKKEISIADDREYYAVILAAIDNNQDDVARRLLTTLENSDAAANPRIMSDLYSMIGDEEKADYYESERQKLCEWMVKAGMYSLIHQFSEKFSIDKDLREGSWSSHF